MRLPAIEALFSTPWPAAARRVLPSASPQLTATAMWGPVLSWCALGYLVESIGPLDPARVALDLFDRLRLRAPLAQAFAALGFEGEEAWRVAARIKVLLLKRADIASPKKAPLPNSTTPPATSAEATATASKIADAIQPAMKSAAAPESAPNLAKAPGSEPQIAPSARTIRESVSAPSQPERDAVTLPPELSGSIPTCAGSAESTRLRDTLTSSPSIMRNSCGGSCCHRSCALPVKQRQAAPKPKTCECWSIQRSAQRKRRTSASMVSLALLNLQTTARKIRPQST